MTMTLVLGGDVVVAGAGAGAAAPGDGDDFPLPHPSSCPIFFPTQPTPGQEVDQNTKRP